MSKPIEQATIQKIVTPIGDNERAGSPNEESQNVHATEIEGAISTSVHEAFSANKALIKLALMHRDKDLKTADVG